MIVSDLTETELIARIQQRLLPAPDWLLVGIGDDAAVVEPERNRVEVLTVDSIVEGVHFDRAFVPSDAIGHRALAVNLSDIAAMGAVPRLALLSIALPSMLPIADFDQLVGGFAALAARYRLHVAGGNLTRSPGPLMIDITVVGTVKRRQVLTRGGARTGDELYVSGAIGGAAAGLQMLKAGLKSPATTDGGSCVTPGAGAHLRPEIGPQFRSDADPRTRGVVVQDFSPACVERYLRPQPRVRLGTLLARNRVASACMDLSDGLADAVRKVASASGVGAEIDVDRLPIDQAARDWFAGHGVDAVTEALRSGDDYELLVAVGPQDGRRLAAAMRGTDVPLTRIGVCTENRALVLRPAAKAGTIEWPFPFGYDHFR